MSTDLSSLLNRPELFVRQRKEWVEILVDWETRNQYSVLSEGGAELALVVEKAGGFWDWLRRSFLGSHRPLEVVVVSPDGSPLLSFRRPFFWLFSALEVSRPDGRRVGEVTRRFGVLYKRYDLSDGLNVVRSDRESTLAAMDLSSGGSAGADGHDLEEVGRSAA